MFSTSHPNGMEADPTATEDLSASTASDSDDSAQAEQRTVAEINLLNLTPGQVDMLVNMFSYHSDVSEFVAGEEYEFEEDDPADPDYVYVRSLKLSHDLKRRIVNNSHQYEVIGAELETTRLYAKYEHVGVLITTDGGIAFQKHDNAIFMLSNMINPMQLSLDQNKMFARVLENLLRYTNRANPNRIKHEIFLNNNLNKLEYVDPQENKNILIYLLMKAPLVSRRSNRNPNETRYEVLGTHFASGTYGTVYYGLGTLIPSAEGVLRFKKHATRVIKEQIHNKKNPVKDVLKECELARATPHMHCKFPSLVMIDGTLHSFTTSRFFSGRSLEEVLHEQRYLQVPANMRHMFKGDYYQNAPSFNIDQRLKLMHLMLIALKEQIHDRGIVHRDLKCSNIIVDVDKDNNPVAVNIIDVGLAKKKEYNDSDRIVGTYGYMPVETFKYAMTDEKSDVFSMAVIMGDILGRLEQDVSSRRKACHVAKRKKFNDLFCGLFNLIDADELNQHEYAAFINLLTAMTERDRTKRCDLVFAIDALEQIIFARKLNMTAASLPVPSTEAMASHLGMFSAPRNNELIPTASLDAKTKTSHTL